MWAARSELRVIRCYHIILAGRHLRAYMPCVKVAQFVPVVSSPRGTLSPLLVASSKSVLCCSLELKDLWLNGVMFYRRKLGQGFIAWWTRGWIGNQIQVCPVKDAVDPTQQDGLIALAVLGRLVAVWVWHVHTQSAWMCSRLCGLYLYRSAQKLALDGLSTLSGNSWPPEKSCPVP